MYLDTGRNRALMQAFHEVELMSDNYFCRSTTTTFAGRPPS